MALRACGVSYVASPAVCAHGSNFSALRARCHLFCRAGKTRLLPSEQPPLPCHLCNYHVDDRWLTAPVGFEAALQRVLEFFRIRYLLAVAANGFGDLHE